MAAACSISCATVVDSTDNRRLLPDAPPRSLDEIGRATRFGGSARYAQSLFAGGQALHVHNRAVLEREDQRARPSSRFERGNRGPWAEVRPFDRQDDLVTSLFGPHAGHPRQLSSAGGAEHVADLVPSMADKLRQHALPHHVLRPTRLPGVPWSGSEPSPPRARTPVLGDC
jgi:hypothetical protein